jgi:hypothetical protein
MEVVPPLMKAAVLHSCVGCGVSETGMVGVDASTSHGRTSLEAISA